MNKKKLLNLESRTTTKLYNMYIYIYYSFIAFHPTKNHTQERKEERDGSHILFIVSLND